MSRATLIAEKASITCQPGQGANGVVASAPPRPGLCSVAAQPRVWIECWITKPTHGDTPAEGPQGCYLTLECTGISSTPGDTQPGGEIAEAPWELENRMEPALVRLRACQGAKKPERGPGLGARGRVRERGSGW